MQPLTWGGFPVQYGVVCCWGLSKAEESEIVNRLSPKASCGRHIPASAPTLLCFRAAKQHTQGHMLLSPALCLVDLQAARGLLSAEEVKIDTYQCCYCRATKPHVANDIITISPQQAEDDGIKVAICHALAQVRLREESNQSLAAATQSIALAPQQTDFVVC